MDDRRVAAAAGLARVAVGGGMLAAPRASGRPWLGADALRRTTQAVVRMLGARDLLLGLGLWRAANGGRSTKAWLAYTAAADAADAAAVLLAWRDLPRWRRLLVLGIAAGSAAAGATLSARAD